VALSALARWYAFRLPRWLSPLTSLQFSLAGLWFGISIPLVLVGSYFGYNKQVRCHLYEACCEFPDYADMVSQLSDPPNKPTLIPRLIPEQVRSSCRALFLCSM
jgi:hypothetical protein